MVFVKMIRVGIGALLFSHSAPSTFQIRFVVHLQQAAGSFEWFAAPLGCTPHAPSCLLPRAVRGGSLLGFHAFGAAPESAFFTYLRARRATTVAQGTIKKLTDKGFGFIQGERGDIFFHHSSVEGGGYDNLREGQAVEYSEGRGPKGPRAENVKVLN